MRTGSDPIIEDPAELDAQADEEAREARWEDFVAAIKARKAVQYHWSNVVDDASIAMLFAEEGHTVTNSWAGATFVQACLDFANDEGWDGVLSAIARAMREQAKA